MYIYINYNNMKMQNSILSPVSIGFVILLICAFFFSFGFKNPTPSPSPPYGSCIYSSNGFEVYKITDGGTVIYVSKTETSSFHTSISVK